jgi:hypothetical protein
VTRLLTEPGRGYHVLDLVAAERAPGGPTDANRTPGLTHWALGYAHEVIDAQANDAYRRRLADANR